MATSQMSEVIQHLRRTVLLREGAGLTDAQLLKDYLSRRDEAVLAVLVRRHGPMVWGVCRRVLSSYHDAEDAFQATFLVLVRKAASIASPELLANWLYGVAHQTALKARATAAKRRARERQVTEMPESAVTEQDFWHDLQPLLDQELSRLPDKYRIAIVLCDLEGKTRKEAARQLSVPDGTLAARLARGRVLLAKRLARRGLAVSGGALGVMLAQNVASASVPTALMCSTIKTVTLFAAGQAAVGLFSARVAGLTEGVIRSMLLSKFKSAVVGLSILCALGIGVGGLTLVTRAAEPPVAAAQLAPLGRDDGNLKETVLALEKRIWEAHCKQDLDVFKSLLADDFVGRDAHGEYYTKAGVLRYVSSFRVRDPEMKNLKVLMLNATSALVTYEISYKVSSADGKNIGNVVHDATTAWAMRDGKWYYVYCSGSAREEGKGGFQLPLSGFPDKRENVDGLLRRAWEAEGKITDSDFIRRVYLDFRGILPSPDEVTKFAQDKDPNKRQKLVARLAAEELQKSSFNLPAVLEKIDAKTSTITVRDATIEKLLEAAFLGKKVDQEFTYDWFAGRERKPATLVNLLITKDAKITDADKAIKVADLKVGMCVSLQLVVDKNRGLVLTGIRLGDKGAEKKP